MPKKFPGKRNFFADLGLRLKSGDKKMATRGAAIQGRTKLIRTKVVQRMKTRCASAGLPSKGGDDETLEKGSVIQSRLCRKSFLEREIFLLTLVCG
ncbi:hypothetical protein GYH33_20350 [Shewanella sp. SE1]|nr:hypothetical protein [Shewanella sp. SE1]